MSQFTCPKCGAPLDVRPGEYIVICSSCQTPTYIDRRNAIFFYYIPFSLDENQAKGVFKRWTAGPDRAKDLEITVKITKFNKEYFPIFSFKRSVNGKDVAIVRSARGTTLPGIRNFTIPPGDLTPYTGGKLEAAILEPDIPLDSYIPSLEGTALSQALVYFPLYEIEYVYNNETFSLVIDGSSGNISSGPSPSRSSASFAGTVTLATSMGLIGSLLGILVYPVFFLLCFFGLFTGKLLGYFVAKQKTGGTE